MRLLAALLLCVIGLSGSVPLVRGLGQPLPHDAYIWQRAWTPPVIAAARQSSDIVRSWRILLAESDQAGRWTSVAVPWADVSATGRPVVGVIRIDGRLDAQRMPALLDQIVARIASAPLAAVEIDYDCPTSKLPSYARFLADLRTRLPRAIALSITALPTWMNSTQLEGVTRTLDEIVLQVHAVDDPRRGLFDADQAERWVREFGRRIHRPFRVALPAYDVRVTWRPDGRLASVEGERPSLAGPSDGEVLSAPPQMLRRFLDTLHRAAPDNLVGVVWFRLPTDADVRAWSLDTWRAVIAGALPAAQLKAGLVATERPGVWTVTVSNEGSVDAALPRRVRLSAGCEMADGANGYRLASAEGPMALETTVGGRLRAHRQRVIGWARCVDAGQEAGKGLDVDQ
jgi:hypothetical protein